MSDANTSGSQLLNNLLEQLGEGPEPSVFDRASASVELKVVTLETLTFSVVQAGVSPVRMLTIANTGASVLPPSTLTVRLRCAMVDGIAGEVRLDLPPIKPGSGIRFPQLDIAPSPATLVPLNESVPGDIRAELKVDGELVASAQGVIQIMAYNEFYNSAELLEIIAAHVLPNHPAITPVLQRAATLLHERTGSPSLEGYQSGPKRVLQIAEAVYSALQEIGIVYINPPASFEDSGQKIRTPDQVLGERLGTCLDLACTYAACLEQAGLHPAIYFIAGHAYAGLFTSEEASATETAALLDHDSVVNLEDAALIVPVETVAYTAGELHSFTDAIAQGRSRLRADGALKSMVSIWRARKDGIRPLPSRVERNGQVTVIVHESKAPAVVPTPDAPPPRTRSKAVAPRVDNSPARLRRWKADLLDLSLRNPLLQMSTRTTGLELLASEGSVGLLEDLLATGNAIKLVAHDELTALHRERGARTAADIDREVRHHLLAENQLMFVDCDSAKLRTRLRALMAKARSAEEETGTNILHLAIGSLRWTDPKTNRAVRSPVLLVPVRLRSAGRGKPVELVIDPTGAPTHNHCLLQKLRSTFDLTIPELDQLKTDAAGLDVYAAIKGLRKAVAEHRLEMRVDEDAVIGLFQFGKFRMWKDLEDHWEFLLKSPVVRHLVENPSESFVDSVALPAGSELEAAGSYCPIPCDGAQLEAVVAAGRGCSFVLEGPPGTGKSQTITNLIANALAAGKRVLFVAEKRAALEVVKRRLEAVGLGAFCLDIHGKDSSPQALRAQLVKSLEAHQDADLAQWGALRSELEARAATLRRYASVVHETSAAGLSAWTARQRLLELGAGPSLSLSPAFLASGEAALRQAITTVQEIPDAAQAAGWKVDHSWMISGIENVALLDREKLASCILHLAAALDAVTNAEIGTGFSELLNAITASNELLLIADLARHLDAGESVSFAGVRGAASSAWQSRVRDLQAKVSEFQQTVAPVLRVFDDSLLRVDVSEFLAAARTAQASFFLFRKGRLRKVLESLGTHVRAPGPAPSDLIRLLEKAADARLVARNLVDHARHIEGLDVPASWQPSQEHAGTQIDSVIARLSAGVPLLRFKEGAALDRVLSEPYGTTRDMEARLRTLAVAIDALFMQLDCKVDALKEWQGSHGLLPRLRQAVLSWKAEAVGGSFLGLARYVRLKSLLATTTRLGMPSLAEDVNAGRLDPAIAPRALARGIAETVLRERMATGGLNSFDALEHNRVVERMAQLQEADGGLLRDVVPARLLATRPFRAGQRFGEVGELARNELSRQKGGLSIRALLEKYSRATIQLTPCLLMSPDSVAQFLKPGVIDFDLVVFDEASQVPVSSAIGAMGRGKSVVIVGDSRQMPPTSFFAGGTDSDQAASAAPPEGAAEDLESILSECVGSGLPRLWLSWHYRSQDESLIAFSNSFYYEGRLSSFPAASAGAHGRGVSWHRVQNGVFDRGATRTNRAEAEAIADVVQQRLRDPRIAESTIGIVTLNLEQCELVTSILEQRAMSDTALDALLTSDDPARRMFVKNLENVQGDERDVILLSVGFARDSKGQFMMNFGPLNRGGGERRWNVAVTRARQQVIVFSSIDPEDIDLARVGVGAVGVRHLRSYLELARDGYASAGDISAKASGGIDRHRDEIAAALRAAGMHVECDVGLSSFKVDLAVSSPDDPSNRLVAILLDGPAYAARRTVQDRDALPTSVLRGLMGWPAIVRVWLPEWLLERDRVIAHVNSVVKSTLDRLRNAKHDADTGEVLTPVSVLHTTTNELPSTTVSHVGEAVSGGTAFIDLVPVPAVPAVHAEPIRASSVVSLPPAPAGLRYAPASERDTEDLDFTPYRVARMRGDRSVLDFANPVADRAAVRRAIDAVLAAEAPIEAVRLAKLVAAQFGLQRVVESRQQAVLSCVPRSQIKKSVLGRFVWREDQSPDSWPAFRRTVADGDRTYDEIAPEEVRNAMVFLTRKGMSMSEEGMVEDLAAIFRVNRITAPFRERMMRVLVTVLKAKQLVRDGDRIVLPH